MRPDLSVHDALARLLAYPVDGLEHELTGLVQTVATGCPQAGAALAPFEAHARSVPPVELEELFTRTFDHTEERALEMGWHAFGENYSRGAFLVRMRELMRENGVEESGELPDHLSGVMAVLGRCDETVAAELAGGVVLPAATKVRDALVTAENPYLAVLEAALLVLAMHESSGAPAAADASGGTGHA